MATNISKEDRITMSKKIVEIPDQNKIVDNVIDQIGKLQIEAEKNDAVNAAIQSDYDEKINEYQPEFNYIDGNKRSEITEDIINSAAKGEYGNGFYLADPQTPIPSVPSGIWKFFAPMAYTYAIGKEFNEVYTVEPLGEEPAINNILNAISQAVSYSVSARATGMECVTVVNPSPPPSNITTLENFTATQNILNTINSNVQKWIDSLNQQKNVIVLTEVIPARLAENQAAWDEIDPLIAILTAWQSITDFETSVSCPLSEDWNSYPPVKLDDDSFDILQNAISDRQTFLSTRKSQLNGYFGTIVQDANTGKVTSYSGWYGNRYLIIDSRINLISGSANGKFGAEKSIETQLQIKESNKTTAAAYDLTMLATKAVAPGIDTNYINVLSSEGFNVGDRVYVVANEQEELSGSVSEIVGNRMKLTFKVPKKYTMANKTRLYKIIDNPL